MSGGNAALLNVRGWCYRKDTSPRTPSADAVLRPKAFQDFVPGLAQENLPDQRQVDEFLINYTSWPGVKSFSAPLGVAVHEDTQTELAPIFLACLGRDSSVAVLTINGAGAHTASVIFITNSNLPAPIVQIDGNDGKTYARPVKNFDAVAFRIDLAIALPAGVLPTAVRNPAGAGGACWQEGTRDQGAVILTFRVEFDRRGQPNQRLGYGEVCVPSELTLAGDPTGRLMFRVNWLGGEWILGSAPNVQKTAKNNEQFLSFNATAFIQSLSVITAPVKYSLRSWIINLAPEFFPYNGQTGSDGDGDEPPSNLIDWERGKFMPNGFTLGFAKGDTTRDAERQTLTPKQVFLIYKNRVGGSNTPTRILVLWWPEVTPNNVPSQVANGQVEADDQLYNVGLSALLDSVTAHNLITKFAMAIMTT